MCAKTSCFINIKQGGRWIFVRFSAASPAFGVCLRLLFLQPSLRRKSEISDAGNVENTSCLLMFMKQPSCTHFIQEIQKGGATCLIGNYFWKRRAAAVCCVKMPHARMRVPHSFRSAISSAHTGSKIPQERQKWPERFPVWIATVSRA